MATADSREKSGLPLGVDPYKIITGMGGGMGFELKSKWTGKWSIDNTPHF